MRRVVARSRKKSKRCPSGKVRFNDRVSATTRMRTIPDTPMRAYHCEMCKGWHLTSQVSRSGTVD